MTKDQIQNIIKNISNTAVECAKLTNAPKTSELIAIAVAFIEKDDTTTNTVRNKGKNLYMIKDKNGTVSVDTVKFAKFQSYSKSVKAYATGEYRVDEFSQEVIDTIISEYDLAKFDIVEELIPVSNNTEAVEEDIVIAEDTPEDVAEVEEAVTYKRNVVEVEFPEPFVNIYRVAEKSFSNSIATGYFDLSAAIKACNKKAGLKVFDGAGNIIHTSIKVAKSTSPIADVVIFKGAVINVSDIGLYQSALDKRISREITGTFYIYSENKVNSRYAICTKKENAGLGNNHILGYVNADDIA